MDEFIKSCNDFSDAFDSRISVVVFLPAMISGGVFLGVFAWMATHRQPETALGLVYPALLWAGITSLIAGIVFTSVLIKRTWGEDE